MKKINSEIKPSAMLMMINLCCEHDWTLPTYEYYSERDPINKDPIWYARCIVKNHHITGNFTSHLYFFVANSVKFSSFYL